MKYGNVDIGKSNIFNIKTIIFKLKLKNYIYLVFFVD